ncbi:UNKNOWN [Stylonychia lemnae]|uniref:non-specific serine/threonine protein kinase n=1 Tax=Stylonychia lemnae TaxID=5949 RepID=A0A078AAI4_STYLE|nr:UNKNOWN [Stylonychia lemnae]|eukprot:CDW79219.1 UNKNOWN [Stylonychia lemnae]
MEKLVAMKIRKPEYRYRKDICIKKGGYATQQDLAQVLTHSQSKDPKQDPGQAIQGIELELLRILREICTFSLRHPNITEVKESYLTNNNKFVIIQELADYDLTGYIEKQGLPNEQKVIQILLQVLNGLDYIHNHDIIHRDISPENILVFKDNTFKICDFGLASFGQVTFASAGKINYMAPEAYRGDLSSDKMCDIWSLGVMLLYLCTGQSTYGNQVVRNFVESHQKDNQKLVLPEQYRQLQDLLNRMVSYKPENRLSIRQIKEILYSMIDDVPQQLIQAQKIMAYELEIKLQELQTYQIRLNTFLEDNQIHNLNRMIETIQCSCNQLQIDMKEFSNLLKGKPANQDLQMQIQNRFQGDLEIGKANNPQQQRRNQLVYGDPEDIQEEKKEYVPFPYGEREDQISNMIQQVEEEKFSDLFPYKPRDQEQIHSQIQAKIEEEHRINKFNNHDFEFKILNATRQELPSPFFIVFLDQNNLYVSLLDGTQQVLDKNLKFMLNQVQQQNYLLQPELVKCPSFYHMQKGKIYSSIFEKSGFYSKVPVMIEKYQRQITKTFQIQGMINKMMRFTNDIIITAQENGSIELIWVVKNNQISQQFKLQNVGDINDICKSGTKNDLLYAFATDKGVYIGEFLQVASSDKVQYQFKLVKNKEFELDLICSTLIQIKQNQLAGTFSKSKGDIQSDIIVIDTDKKVRLLQISLIGMSAIFRVPDYNYQSSPYGFIKDHQYLYLIELNNLKLHKVAESIFKTRPNHQSLYIFEEFNQASIRDAKKYRIFDLEYQPGHAQGNSEIREIEIQMPL